MLKASKPLVLLKEARSAKVAKVAKAVTAKEDKEDKVAKVAKAEIDKEDKEVKVVKPHLVKVKAKAKAKVKVKASVARDREDAQDPELLKLLVIGPLSKLLPTNSWRTAPFPISPSVDICRSATPLPIPSRWTSFSKLPLSRLTISTIFFVPLRLFI